jgi:hypothetical protein
MVSNDHLAAAEIGYVLAAAVGVGAGRSHLQDDVRLLEHLAARGDYLRALSLVLGVREPSRCASACLHEHIQARFSQGRDHGWDHSYTTLTGKRLLENSNDHE